MYRGSCGVWRCRKGQGVTMSRTVKGKCYTCGDNMTVYQVIPEVRWTMKKMDPEEMGRWVFETELEGAQDTPGAFQKQGYEIVVAGENFGCGSKSVEHPMAALKGAGVKAVLAESFSRYSYRNAINLALPVLVAPGISAKVSTGDIVRVDYGSAEIVNETTGEKLQAQPLGEFALGILEDGGLLKHVEKELGEQAAL